MSAIRRDEEPDNIHSIYVDQWDWEKIITREQRSLDTLEDVVRTVYKVLRKTEKYMSIHYDYIEEILPHDIFFVTTGELEEMFPDNTPKEREYYIAKAKGAVCIMQIGGALGDGKPHCTSPMWALRRKNMQMRDWPMPPPMVKGTSSWITAWWKGSCARSMHPAASSWRSSASLSTRMPMLDSSRAMSRTG